MADITAVLEQFAPLRIQESWDNSGLIIGSPEDDVHGVLVGFDCTPALILEAVEKGCDMVVTHHPLIFKGIKRIDGKDPVGAAIMQAIRSGVAVYAAHTTADKVITGVSGAMARRLELKNVSIMVPEEDGTIGLGCIGEFPQPMNGMQALKYVQEKFGLKVIKSSKPLETPITKVALLGGSGGGEIPLAQAKGAQLYITADISYHNFFTPEGFMLMDVGHFESEVEIVDIFVAQIRKKFPTFASYKSDALDRSNPVHYFVV
ncbi:MAG: Nif3-like dinuclear metal center hexameric protein [Bacteroidales bacterium]|nr:Nif3-like dinuclear metal center hexameric protein [Bacteroidales bacterium]